MKFGGNGGVHVQTSDAMETAVTVADRLDCPETVGDLTRTGAAADGASCDYRSDRGVIHLAYADATGADPSLALAPIRASLDGELPGIAKDATIQVVSEKDAAGGDHTRVDMPFIHVEDHGKDADGHNRAKVDMPFLHVDDDGKHSKVRLFGMTIDSDDDHHGRHHRKVVDVDEDDDDAGANTTAVSTVPFEQRGVELVYVLVGEKPTPAGYHAVGYVAKGARTGKLVVATFHYVKGDHSYSNGERNDSDVDALMRLNVKPA